MAKINKTETETEPREVEDAIEVKEAPKPKVPKPKVKRKPKLDLSQGLHKIINDEDYIYCAGFYSYYPAASFKHSAFYSDEFLLSKKQIKE